ncbi:uncharacterized protein LOC121874037 isoform X2 [Homarus americanus]|uniref:uncharacterized protein LOC121874037 isoform X2 n=1 Tax=Homarus americanus TaxID=6706 RepID=UPI001C46CBE9|nr:uncharacterized protein LOC121874037 isoform X2 [Homarus americanus]
MILFLFLFSNEHILSDNMLSWQEIQGGLVKRRVRLTNKAMEMLKNYQGDIDRLRQELQQKDKLMEGIVILMTKILERDADEVNMKYDDDRGNMKYDDDQCVKEHGSALCCAVCTHSFNARERRPTLLTTCGHSVCKDCIRERSNRGLLHCPICRKFQNMAASDLPTNWAVLSKISKKDDFMNNEKGTNEQLTNPVMMSFEEQIEHALNLSCREMLRLEVSHSIEKDPTSDSSTTCLNKNSKLLTSPVMLSYEEQLQCALIRSRRGTSVKNEEDQAACAYSFDSVNCVREDDELKLSFEEQLQRALILSCHENNSTSNSQHKEEEPHESFTSYSLQDNCSENMNEQITHVGDCCAISAVIDNNIRQKEHETLRGAVDPLSDELASEGSQEGNEWNNCQDGQPYTTIKQETSVDEDNHCLKKENECNVNMEKLLREQDDLMLALALHMSLTEVEQAQESSEDSEE